MKIIPLTATSLSQVIRSEFANTTPPKAEDSSCVHMSATPSMRCRFIGRRWHELTVAEISEDVDAIFFVGPALLAYFLPAYMLSCVEAYDEVDLAPNHLVAILTHSSDKSRKEQELFEEMVGWLGTSQREAVAWFLLFLVKQHAGDFALDEPIQALIGFWGRYLGNDLE